jgi:hypothetical protein
MSGRLNMFQRTMLRWRDLHPYNAVHVVIVTETLDSARLSDAIAQQMQALGLADLELDRARGRYEWRGGRGGVDLRLLSDGDPQARVHDEIARQLNAAYPADGRISPFRFFAVDAGSSFHLGLAYDHFVAGGDSIVRLLCGIVSRYRGEPVAQAAVGAASMPSYGRLFLRQAGAVLRGLASLPGIAASCRRSFRPVYTAIDDGQNAFARLRLGLPEQEALVRAAKTWGVTQNDLFMTILLKVLSPLAANRRQESTRREIAVASIVNIRRDFGSEAQNAFVPLLASFRVSHPAPDEISVEELAHSVHEESTRIRQGKLYLQSLLGLGLAALQWRFLSEAHRRRFFAKHYAVWAGTTPLNVAPLWAHAGGRGPAPEYLRAVSTGPLAPMICAISTADEVVNVGISYRTAAFDASTVDGVVADMLSHIKSL